MDQVSRALLVAGGGAAAPTYVDDVFSTFLYTGSGSSQTITNGINLSTNGGMVWIKNRTIAASHVLTDTVRGAGNTVSSDLTDAQAGTNFGVNTFLSTGFAVANNNDRNNNSTRAYASWTFRKAPKFFDVVTYTGNGVSGRTIAHSLGVKPGMIIIKSTSAGAAFPAWTVGHRSFGGSAGGYSGGLELNLTGTGDANNFSYFANTEPTSSVFTLPNIRTNDNGVSYVAYLFAHDTAADGLIQCGSFTTDGSGNASVTTLGWEPQFLMVKASSTTGDWIMLDTMRGWNLSTADALLRANLTNAETTSTEYGNPTATGFDFKGGSASATYVYMAIRRPNKPASYVADGYFSVTGSASWPTRDGSLTMRNGSAHAKDALITFPHVLTPTSPPWLWADMLRGYAQGSEGSPTLDSSSMGSEVVRTTAPSLTGSGANTTTNSAAPIIYVFRRAPGFFDVVCYTGNGAANTIPHNLGVSPEMAIVKRRNGSTNWFVTVPKTLIATNGGFLNLTDALVDAAQITGATSFSYAAGFTDANASGGAYVAYLFASVPGLSKVGTYTGNGSSQTINCGFTTGARFVLIKRANSAGDWYVWDTVQGIVAANDPHLSLNTGVARVGTDDSLDPDNTGFIVNQVAATNINVTSATYLYLAIA